MGSSPQFQGGMHLTLKLKLESAPTLKSKFLKICIQMEIYIPTNHSKKFKRKKTTKTKLEKPMTSKKSTKARNGTLRKDFVDKTFKKIKTRKA